MRSLVRIMVVLIKWASPNKFNVFKESDWKLNEIAPANTLPENRNRRRNVSLPLYDDVMCNIVFVVNPLNVFFWCEICLCFGMYTGG